MWYANTIRINFKGGVISPGDLLKILNIVRKSGLTQVSIGLRQQLLIEAGLEEYPTLKAGLKAEHIDFEVDRDKYPNIISSYPAEEIFISKTWLSEGVYKDVFDSFDYKPSLKINISDSNQSFTPFLTGNINWVAAGVQHFWYLIIRFPKTNTVYYWKDIVYTNDVAAMSKKIESIILENPDEFYDNPKAAGDDLYVRVMNNSTFITKKAEEPVRLPPFMLPYYEGFNKYQDKNWLGIYRRDELFPVKFLQDVCQLCLATKLGQICSTPWKSLIIKGIEDKDKAAWNEVLGKHQVNVRHAANELNFQVEDDCMPGLQLKNYLVKYLNKDDTRTFGICIGIKTRRKSEVFSSILVRRKSLFTIGDFGFFNLYDILFAKDFNPNERTGEAFSRNNIKLFLPEQLRRAVIHFYANQAKNQHALKNVIANREEIVVVKKERLVHQCRHCLTVYDDLIGDPDHAIAPGTPFADLPENYTCPTCEEPKEHFEEITVA